MSKAGVIGAGQRREYQAAERPYAFETTDVMLSVAKHLQLLQTMGNADSSRSLS
jgi:hypothetical protein